MKDSSESKLGVSAETPNASDILVVDDEKNMVIVIQLSFEAQSDFHIEPSYSGNGAIRKISSGYNPDAILTDIFMPDGTGLDLYRWLKANRPALADRVIAMTAGFNRDDLAEFEDEMTERGRLLKKPFSVDRLRDLVKQALSDREK